MKKTGILSVLLMILGAFQSVAKSPETPSPANGRPKLVVGLVVDQMRWDFLYRYFDRYSQGGFKRMMEEGFNCEQTLIPYTPTVTAAGHASIYTGTVPAVHGITGNNFYVKSLQRGMYCTEDKSVKTVGADNANGEMSPRNMLTTSICDELKLATNFRSKIIGISIKDRGAILPAGHSADGAYWYDSKTGNFITSTFYMASLPKWVEAFNASGAVLKYYEKNWATLYPLNTYLQSDKDQNNYESTPFGADQQQFPYDLKRFVEKKNFGPIRFTPHANSLSFDFARQAVQAESMGKDSVTDFLAISLSSPDYIGHAFGPNSVEAEDTYLRLDKDIADFLAWLDKEVGKGQYTVFLTADHGVAHIPGFLEKHRLPNGGVTGSKVEKALNAYLKEQFGRDSLCVAGDNYQFTLNKPLMDSAELSYEDILIAAMQFLQQQPGIDRVLEYVEMAEAVLPAAIKEQFSSGYYPDRCGDIFVILKPGYIDDEYGGKGTTHGIWNPYDAHIPLLFYGYGVAKGKTYQRVEMIDIAPTLAALLHIQMPSGSIGKVIAPVLK